MVEIFNWNFCQYINTTKHSTKQLSHGRNESVQYTRKRSYQNNTCEFTVEALQSEPRPCSYQNKYRQQSLADSSLIPRPLLSFPSTASDGKLGESLGRRLGKEHDAQTIKFPEAYTLLGKPMVIWYCKQHCTWGKEASVRGQYFSCFHYSSRSSPAEEIRFLEDLNLIKRKPDLKLLNFLPFYQINDRIWLQHGLCLC